LTPEKVWTLGRLSTSDIQSSLGAVSRKHAKIFYDDEHGWMIQEYDDAPSASGTWVHPKTYFKARLG
jgi:pSer/pThr/pTyr-binding forkhead associated (FHA) protein